MQEAEAGSTTSSGTVETTSPAATDTTSAPAATDAAAAPGETQGVDDFSALVEGVDEEGDGQPAASTPAATPTTPAKETPPAAAAPAAVSAAKPGEVATPAATEAPAPAAKPAEAPATPAAPAAETAEAKAAREAVEKATAEKQFQGLVDHYKIPEDMAAKLASEPENVLPFVAAKLHQNVLQQVQSLLSQQLPTYIQQVQAIAEHESKMKNAFYAANKDLVNHEEAVLKAGMLYRQMNPSATPEVAIKAIGDIVRASLGLQAPGGAPPTPSAPAAATPAFVPAGAAGGAAARAPAASEDQNEFARLAMEE